MSNNKANKIINSSGRNYGIDALRIYAMFLVLILHVLGQGGVLNTAKGSHYAIAWLLEIAAYCSVNCFAMVSGYVSYREEEKPYRYGHFLSLWLQVVFYSFGLTLLYYMKDPEMVGMEKLWKSLIPVATNHYWYFTAYAGLFFVIPWINLFMRRCTKKEADRCVMILFLVFSCYMTWAKEYTDAFKLSSGYSFLWLTLMYVAGAWMKKCHVDEKMKLSTAWGVLIGSVLFTWLFKFVSPVLPNMFISYTSPTVVLMAVSYVVLFSRLKITGIPKKLVVFFSPAAFGVYLIHVQGIVWKELMQNRFTWISEEPAWMLPALVIGCAVWLLIGCMLIEKVRIWLFKVCRIDWMVDIITKRFTI